MVKRHRALSEQPKPAGLFLGGLPAFRSCISSTDIASRPFRSGGLALPGEIPPGLDFLTLSDYNAEGTALRTL